MSRFNVESHLHRLVGRSRHVREVIWIRRYKNAHTAIKRCIDILTTEGQVGDVVEIVLMNLGRMDLGTIRYRATGSIEVLWNDTEAKKLRNQQLLGK